ncbi:MAG TPA: protein translocase subunit SecF [Oligoflexia bacterium]|nr:protein translocase subunit SecF [Oligoflexia bacterium]HMP26529.1 protein translocase subunit SecF [Oligoflexia bacterium]
MLDIVPVGTKIDFLGYTKHAAIFSGLLILASLYIFLNPPSEPFGLDFLGGYESVVRFVDDPGAGAIRERLADQGIRDSIVQSFESGSKEYSVRIFGDFGDGQEIKHRLMQALKVTFPDKFTVLKDDLVGPVVGNELLHKAFWALLLCLISMLIYVAIRFEFAFGFGAVVALFHDVLICCGFYLFFGHSFTMSTIAAALTIIGYSINDTIVVFDRVREERHKRKDASLWDLINECNNLTLSRTIITHLLTLFSALALLYIGGGSLADLSFFLVIGILLGSYSTVYVAAPLALFWEKVRGRPI